MMAEDSKVRLVRCPKCQKLLPELPEYSVYKCGACGAILRAKKKMVTTSKGFVAKSIEDKGEKRSAEAETLLERGGISLATTSRTERENYGRRKEGIFGDRMENFSNSSSRADSKELSTNDRNVREYNMDLRLNQNRGNTRTGGVAYYVSSLKNPRAIDRWVHRDNCAMNTSLSKPVSSSRGDKVGNCSPHLADYARSTRGVIDQWGMNSQKHEFGWIHGKSRLIDQQVGSSAVCYHDEGASNYKPSSLHGYCKPVNRGENLENNSPWLLWNLDDLKDQLSKSRDGLERPSERVPSGKKIASTEPFASSVASNVSVRPSSTDNHASKLLYSDDIHKPIQTMDEDDHVQSFYPASKHVQATISRHGGHLRPQMLGQPYHQEPLHHFSQQRTHEYSSRHHRNFGEDPLGYPQEISHHQHTCSFSQCYNDNLQVPSQLSSTSSGHGRFLNDQWNPNTHYRPFVIGQANGPRGAKCSAFHSRDPQQHIWPSDTDSDIEGNRRGGVKKVVVTHGNRHVCHPIASGAPFIICYNCSELLKLPGKLRKIVKCQQKLQCGACSTIIMFKIENKRLVFSIPSTAMERSVEVEEGSSELYIENIPSSCSCSNAGGTLSCSSDFDYRGYDVHYTDIKGKSVLDGQVKFIESESCLTSSFISLEEKDRLESVALSRDHPNLAQLPMNDDDPPIVSCLPHREHFGNPASYYSMSRHKKKQIEHKMVIPNSSALRADYVEDTQEVTEVEVSCNEYLNTSLSQDSLEASKEENLPRINKGGESFLIGLVKKSLKDFSRFNQSIMNERYKVWVNGQPISDHVVKKAERRAGPIHPGEYWYDYRAGFWGVMGQPCLGLIPPYIEEFIHPLPENCAAGNTGVFVNGRELHQRDLDILASKGLPTTKDKRYIVEISGRVFVEDTGTELDSLGKLAPTVERVNCGFGMRVPREVGH